MPTIFYPRLCPPDKCAVEYDGVDAKGYPRIVRILRQCSRHQHIKDAQTLQDTIGLEGDVWNKTVEAIVTQFPELAGKDNWLKDDTVLSPSYSADSTTLIVEAAGLGVLQKTQLNNLITSKTIALPGVVVIV